jgi:hypothetical protein
MERALGLTSPYELSKPSMPGTISREPLNPPGPWLAGGPPSPSSCARTTDGDRRAPGREGGARRATRAPRRAAPGAACGATRAASEAAVVDAIVRIDES